MLAFAFIFGNSVRNVFECVVWLFVVHPYDVGDTLVLSGENHRVSGHMSGPWAGGWVGGALLGDAKGAKGAADSSN